MNSEYFSIFRVYTQISHYFRLLIGSAPTFPTIFQKYKNGDFLKFIKLFFQVKLKIVQPQVEAMGVFFRMAHLKNYYLNFARFRVGESKCAPTIPTLPYVISCADKYDVIFSHKRYTLTEYASFCFLSHSYQVRLSVTKHFLVVEIDHLYCDLNPIQLMLYHVYIY